MGGFLKCVDPDDPNKFLLIRDGEIVFYENINGVPTPVTPMTQIGLYDAAGGESFTPNERYKEAPEVFVQPRSIRTVEINGAGIDQMIEIDAPEITGLSAGKYQINIRLPPRVYRTPHDADMLYICRAAAKLFSYQRLYGFLHRHAGADIHYPQHAIRSFTIPRLRQLRSYRARR